jgi:fido (protein-threonine AMPylation protein)
MSTTKKLTEEALLQAVRKRTQTGQAMVTSTQLVNDTGGSPATVKRMLERLLSANKLVKQGRARATRYSLAVQVAMPSGADTPATAVAGPQWSESSVQLLKQLSAPLGAREPVTYHRGFVEDYKPNASALLPAKLSEELTQLGRMHGQQPAGTYARKVLEQLLIDLSWSSSRLEGNTYSLLATEELFKSGVSDGNVDAVMLLNHKSAIEFLIDAVPTYGLSMGLVRNLHSVLMRDLLPDVDDLGTIRNKVVNISDTVYVPSQVPTVLEEMLESIISKARLIKNPIETAFFLWLNLAYLQPFADGNKRVSRLAANIPLMLYNQAPLSFLDVSPQDYAQAVLGVYEFRDVSIAVDLFDWTYRRSLKKYTVILESMGTPDPVRLRYREMLNEAVGLVVRDKNTLHATLAVQGVTEASAPGFQALLTDELKNLEVFNCARYRLTMTQTASWIAAGRPS